LDLDHCGDGRGQKWQCGFDEFIGDGRHRSSLRSLGPPRFQPGYGLEVLPNCTWYQFFPGCPFEYVSDPVHSPIDQDSAPAGSQELFSNCLEGQRTELNGGRVAKQLSSDSWTLPELSLLPRFRPLP